MSAPDQRIRMLVTVAREAVEQVQKSAEDWQRCIAGDDPPVTPEWHPKMVAVLKQFEDIP